MTYLCVVVTDADARHQHGQQLGGGPPRATCLLVLGSGCTVPGPEESDSGITAVTSKTLPTRCLPHPIVQLLQTPECASFGLLFSPWPLHSV